VYTNSPGTVVPEFSKPRTYALFEKPLDKIFMGGFIHGTFNF